MLVAINLPAHGLVCLLQLVSDVKVVLPATKLREVTMSSVDAMTAFLAYKQLLIVSEFCFRENEMKEMKA